MRHFGDLGLEAETERIQSLERTEKPGHTYNQADRLQAKQRRGSKKNDQGKSIMERKRKKKEEEIIVTWASSSESHQSAVDSNRKYTAPGIKRVSLVRRCPPFSLSLYSRNRGQPTVA